MGAAGAGDVALGTLKLYVGIDLGTSGCRAIAITADGDELATSARPMPLARRHGPAVEQSPDIWWHVTRDVLRDLRMRIGDHTIAGIAVDGTSGTLLLADAAGNPLGPALMYNDARGTHEAAAVAAIAPSDWGAHGASSSLAKLLWLHRHRDLARAHHALHQADWIAGRLTGIYGISDYNNALKLGFDAGALVWPDWLTRLAAPLPLLPQVRAPGDFIAPMDPRVAHELALPDDIAVFAGTTDSVAAFCATGASTVGDAVTSLGSTLVLKVLATEPVYAPPYGIYSHRYGDLWLAGGASNSGGAVLRQYFSDDEMAELSRHIDPERPTGLDYYPLPAPGERFPIANPALAPRLTPHPANDAVFFQGLLEGIANIEAEGYRCLNRLGAPYPASVRSVGTGAQNTAWIALRRQRLSVPFLTPRHHAAAFGAAWIARNGCLGYPGFSAGFHKTTENH